MLPSLSVTETIGPFGHQVPGHTHAAFQQASGVIPQVQHQGLHALVLQFLEFGAKIFGGVFIEIGHPDIPDVPFIHAPVDALQFDVAAGHSDVLWLLVPSLQGQGHLGTIFAPDLFHHLVQVLAGKIIAVDFQQDIPGFDPGLEGRCILNGRHHHEPAILLLAHDHAHPAEMAFGHGGQGRKILVVQVGRIGIVQNFDHAFQCPVINGFPIGFPLHNDAGSDAWSGRSGKRAPGSPIQSFIK